MNTYKMTLEDSVDSMTFDLLEVPIVDKDVEGAVDNTTLDGNIFTDYLWLKKNYVQKWSILCDDEYSQLRGFYTRQFDNASVPTYKLFYGENISQDMAVSGDYILVNNPTDRNAPITSFELLGDAEQDGTPTPDAPIPVNTVTGEQTVSITGKNLVNQVEANKTVSSSGVIGAGNTNYLGIESAILCRPSTTYSVSFEHDDPTANIYVGYWDENGTWISRTGYGTDRTFTTPNNAHSFFFYLNKSGITFPTIGGWVQVELSNSPTAYEPYQGQTLALNLGKNLIQNTLLTESTEKNGVTATPNSDGTFTLNGTATANGYFNFYRDGTILTASTYITDIGSTTKSATTGNFTYSGSITNGRIYSLAYDNSNRYWFFVTKQGETYNNAILKVQCEAGTQATSFAPYFTPIELAKIGDYQDRIYKTGDKWYLEKQVGKVVYTGAQSESWAYVSGDHARFTISDSSVALSPSSTTVGAVMSDHFTPSTTDAIYTGADEKIAVHATIHQFWLSYFAITSVANFKTWLASNPTTVYYALATPTTTEITNSELVGQLEAILQAYLYTGTNNVSNNAVSPNLAGQMNIGYRLIFSEETVLIEPTAVRLTLTDGGIINVCGCRQNVQLTMRETIQ